MTRLFRLLIPAVMPLLAAFCLDAAQAQPPVPMTHPAPGHRLVFDPKKFMRVSELRPGMRGYALTVFKGTKIDKFHIEILGVVSKFNEGKDYILFRALDGPSVTRHLNIAHGMSGSPIYINNRLVGAISMGIPGTLFARDPIALATPIEDMFDSWSPDLPSKPVSIGAAADSGAGSAPASADAAAAQSFQQIDLPVTVSGMTPGSLLRLRTALAPYHMAVMAGGGAGGGADANNPLAQGATLVPGAAVGVSLVQGDMDLTATGTVTYRDGNRVLLFGHPFTDFGPVDAAMTTAYVVDIFPSYQDSIKLGSPIKTVGRIFQDRPFSVGGLIGSMPQMVPMTVDVNDLSIKRHKIFHMRVINHPLLTGSLVPQLADAAIAQVHGQPGDSIATVTMDADVEQIGHVKRTNTFYDAVSIDQSAIGDVDSLMRLLSSNPFYPLALKSLKMDVTIQNRHDTAEVDHIFVKQGKFAPGDTVSVGIVLKPFKRDLVTRYVSLKIPNTVSTGALTLTVKGGGSDSGGISLGGGIILLRPSDPTSPVGNIEQLVKQFTNNPRNDELVARLILPTSAINIQGEKLTMQPPTMAAVMQATHTSGLKTERDEVKVVQGTPYVVSGTQSLTIAIEKKPIADPGVASSTPSPAPAASGDSSGAPPPDDSTVSAFLPSPAAGNALIAPATTTADQGTHPKTKTATKGSAATTQPTGTPPTAAVSATPASPAAQPKTVGRLASIWRQGTSAEFAAGTLQNVSVTSNGDIRLSASLTKVAETGETYLWALLPDTQGGIYAGTGNKGIIYRFDADGKPKVLFNTGQLEVTALARDGQGDLFAGTAPHGIVYKIGPDGKGKEFFKAGEKYVTALAFDGGHERLYVATGGGTGRVYAVPTTGTAPTSALFTSPEAHILSLALDKNGNVYAGSSPDGIVYKITPSGTNAVFYDVPEQSISALTTDSSNNVYAGTTTKGVIYKIAPDGTARVLSDRATSSVLSLQTDTSDNLYACAGNTIYRISPDETVQSFVAPTDEQFLSLAVDRSNGQVYTGTSTVGSLYKIGASGDVKGQFVSTVHDAGLPAHWGTISWTANTPPGTQIMLQTRSGDVERPDASWSVWSVPYATPSGQKVLSPPGRYLQYQATLTGDSSSVPRLRDVSVYYLPRNQPPTVHLLSPADGDALSKTATLRWSGGDPDKDTLTFDLSYSSDGGKTWTPIKKSSAPHAVAKAPTATTKSSATAAAAPVTDQEVQAEVRQMEASLDAHPELPAAVRAQMIAQAPEMARESLTIQHAAAATTAASTAATAGDLKETSFAWDTTTVPDGLYQIKIVASDKVSNPQDALTAKDVSPTFLVANTLPTLLTGDPAIGTDKSVTIRGTVLTQTAFVKAVQAKVDGGDPIAAVADDGLFDSTLESYTLVTAPLSSGSHKIEVQVIDQAGNMTSKQVSVQVP